MRLLAVACDLAGESPSTGSFLSMKAIVVLRGMTGSKKHLKPLKTRELGKAKIERRLTASWRLRFSWNFAGRRPWVTDHEGDGLSHPCPNAAIESGASTTYRTGSDR